MAADTDLEFDTLEPASILAYVRSLIPDMEQLKDPTHPEAEASYLFDDATLMRYVAFARGQNPKRAAADACEAVAGSEALILKVITTEDLVTNGAALAKEWGAKATRLRKAADDDDAAVDDDNSGFFAAPFIRRPQPFQPNQYPASYGGYGRRFF